jgi:hypothetical protein
MERRRPHELIGLGDRSATEPSATSKRSRWSGPRDQQRAHRALDRLGETVEAILHETGMTEGELVAFLDPSRPMPS